MDASERLPWGEGMFRRRFLLRGAPRRVVGDMEDDFHRFRVVLEHDGRYVTGVRGEAHRYPWTECPGAASALETLVGLELSHRTTAAGGYADPRANCTHMFDLAALAVAHAAAGRDQRLYDIEIPDRNDRKTTARLRRDREDLLAWEIDGETIREPAPFSGVHMRGGDFLRWAEATLEPELAEAAIALRRACYIGMGRFRDLDLVRDASAYLPLASGSCHTFTPGRAERALRMRGTQIDFTNAPDRLLADLLP